MSESASISSGIAQRYATAVFGLAKDDNGLAGLETDVDALDAALAESADLRDLISSPVYTREAQSGAMAAIGKKMGLSTLMMNTLAVMGQKRRLFVLPQMATLLHEMISVEKGEITAEVVSATELSPAQAKSLSDTLKAQVGKDIRLKASVDESLIGGLVVRVGSRMIDTSVKAKLAALQNAMKEVR